MADFTQRLPLELRREIYRKIFHFAADKNVPISPFDKVAHATVYSTGILSVSKLIHHEAAEILYGDTQFYFEDYGELAHWLECIGSHHACHIKHIIYDTMLDTFCRLDHWHKAVSLVIIPMLSDFGANLTTFKMGTECCRLLLRWGQPEFRPAIRAFIGIPRAFGSLRPGNLILDLPAEIDEDLKATLTSAGWEFTYHSRGPSLFNDLFVSMFKRWDLFDKYWGARDGQGSEAPDLVEKEEAIADDPNLNPFF